MDEKEWQFKKPEEQESNVFEGYNLGKLYDTVEKAKYKEELKDFYIKSEEIDENIELEELPLKHIYENVVGQPVKLLKRWTSDCAEMPSTEIVDETEGQPEKVKQRQANDFELDKLHETTIEQVNYKEELDDFYIKDEEIYERVRLEPLQFGSVYGNLVGLPPNLEMWNLDTKIGPEIQNSGTTHFTFDPIPDGQEQKGDKREYLCIGSSVLKKQASSPNVMKAYKFHQPNYSDADKSKLNQHKNSGGDREKAYNCYMCDQCEYLSFKRGKLEEHKLYIHGTTKEYKASPRNEGSMYSHKKGHFENRIKDSQPKACKPNEFELHKSGEIYDATNEGINVDISNKIPIIKLENFYIKEKVEIEEIKFEPL